MAVEFRIEDHAGPTILDHSDCGNFTGKSLHIRYGCKTRLSVVKGWRLVTKYWFLSV